MRKEHVFLKSTSCVFSVTVLLAYVYILLDITLLTVPVSAETSESTKYLKDDIFFEIVEPESLRYTFRLRPAHEFGSSFVSQLSNVGLVISEPSQGCSSAINKLELRHNVVLIARGQILAKVEQYGDVIAVPRCLPCYILQCFTKKKQICNSITPEHKFTFSVLERIAYTSLVGCSFLSKCIHALREGALAVIIMDDNANNDDQYIDMMDDSTHRNCSIPATFLLGRDGYMIRRGLQTHGLQRAIINIPINVSQIPVQKLKRPPWVVW